MKKIIFLAFVILLSQRALACLDFGDVIDLSNASFENNKIVLKREYKKDVHHHIESGENRIWYDHSSNCWKIDIETKKCMSDLGKDYEYQVMADNDPTKKVATIEFNDANKTLFIFSVNSKGQKLLREPYLKFTETQTSTFLKGEDISTTYTWTSSEGKKHQSRTEPLSGEFINSGLMKVEAYENGVAVGEHSSAVTAGLVPKGVALFGDPNKIQLRGTKSTVKSCGKVDVKAFGEKAKLNVQPGKPWGSK